MRKADSFRAALVAILPELAAESDRLSIWVDDGSIAATGGKSSSFEWRYTLHVLVQDFAGDADLVMIAVVEWARKNQPDLLTNPEHRARGITYEIDVLSRTSVDLSLKIHLTESVVVKYDAAGNRTIKHVDDSAETWVASL